MKSFFKKIKDGFKRTQEVVSDGIQAALQRSPKFDEDLYDEIEAILLRGDVGPATTDYLLTELRARVKRDKLEDSSELSDAMRAIMEDILTQGRAAGDPLSGPESPRVVMVVGVNGVGKTTSLAKLARRVQEDGRTPVIAAADTYRAAASEQLEIWANRLGVHLVKSQHGADPGAVAFDGVQAGKARNANVVFVDTAGRLQTQAGLMAELTKIHRVCGKAMEGAPHEVLLVLDATIGQNAISQARLFSESVPVTGILLAKLDGTSKGGVVLAISHELGIPVRYAGVGEKADDLVDFDPKLFAEGLVPKAE